MGRFWWVGLLFLLVGCGTAERNLRPLEAPTPAVTATAEPWQTFENSEFSIQYPAVWSPEASANDVRFFDAQGELVGVVKTGREAELWSEGLQPFEEALDQYSGAVGSLEADAGVVTEYSLNMSVAGITMIDDEPATVLVLVILHEGRAAVISGVIDRGVERAVIEEMMGSFRFLVVGAS